MATGAYDGVIQVKGNKLVNGHGVPTFLVGPNMSGMEYAAINGENTATWGGVVPNWATWASRWKTNAVRIPQNAASFLGLTVGVLAAGSSPIQASSASWASTRSADPQGTYLATLKSAIDGIRGIKHYPIIDLHWCAPQLTLSNGTNYLAPLGQPFFMDRATGLPFWTGLYAQLVTWYGAGNFNDIIFELFNEPQADSYGLNMSTTPDLLLLNGGTNGRCQNWGSGPFEIDSAAIPYVGYQEVINDLRALGCSNVIMCNGNQFAEQMQNFLSVWKPLDTTAPAGFVGTWTPQVCCGMHPYPTGSYPYSDGDVYGKNGSESGSGTAACMQFADAVIAAGVPVVVTEDGGSFGPSIVGEAHCTWQSQHCWDYGWSGYVWWESANQLSSSSSGVFQTSLASPLYSPTVGQGQVDNAFAAQVTGPNAGYIPATGAGMPVSYTIEGNTAAGGGAAPSSGWVVLATVTGNTQISREHLVDLSTYNWVRMNCSAVNSGTGPQIKMNVYDAITSPYDGIFWAGDQVSAACMQQCSPALGSYTPVLSLAQLIYAGGTFTYSEPGGAAGSPIVISATGFVPLQENAGQPNYATTDLIAALPGWLANFTGRYVVLAIGANNATTSGNESQFYTDMVTLIMQVFAANKIPIVPTIPWSSLTPNNANVPLYNAQLTTLFANYPQVIPGPDFYTFFANTSYGSNAQNNQTLISTPDAGGVGGDGIVPNTIGAAYYRALAAQWFASNIYSGAAL